MTSTGDISATQPIPAADGRDQEMVCACRGLTLRQMHSLLAAHPEYGFDRFTQETGAGSVCTACLLDLEYHFVTAPRDASKLVRSVDENAGQTASESTKQKLYRYVDLLSPIVPFPLRNIMPVIAGPGIAEYVCVANRSLLFEGAECAPETEIELVIRDAAGKLRHRHVESLAPESMLRFDVSRHLDQGSGVTVGSVLISRRAKTPGIRGTTRPQIEIVARAGACALHGQAATRASEGFVTVLHRPGEERIFLSLLNATSRPLAFALDYPFGVGADDTRHIALPPHGAHLHEIVLSSEQSARLQGSPFAIRWRAAGTYKVHILCATPSLDRFSIDHL